MITAQEPAAGIMKTNDWGDTKVYSIACDCGMSDHNHIVWVTADDCRVNVQIYTNVTTKFWDTTIKPRYDIDNWWLQKLDWFWKGLVNGLANRLKLTWSLWINGYLEEEATICLTEQQACNYSNALMCAVTDVREFNKNYKEKPKE
jgi:hypothetical protein